MFVFVNYIYIEWDVWLLHFLLFEDLKVPITINFDAGIVMHYTAGYAAPATL